MTQLLLFTAIILLACSILKKLSGKLGLPSLLLFIIFGMLVGSDGLFKIPFDDFSFAQGISTIALVMIMFTGGFETNVSSARPVLLKALVFSSFGTIFTALLVGVFCHYLLGMTLLEGMLCGSVLASTDAASVFSVLRSKKLALKENTASLLEIESGSNDPFAYMLTIVVLAAMGDGISWGSVTVLFIKQIFIGLIFGFGIGKIAKHIMINYRFDTSGIETIFILGSVLVGYAGCTLIDGNGFLSVYIIGIILGNAHLKENNILVPFFDGITTTMQAILFFLLGLLAFPSRMGSVFTLSILIVLFLTFIARPLVIFLLSIPFKGSVGQKILVSFAGLRGAASIVFAIQAVLDPAYLSYDIYHIVFIIVLLSIAVQGSLLPLVSQKLDMIDKDGDVLKTFTDYVDERPVNYIQFTITCDHEYCNKMIKDITLPPNSLIVNLNRDTESIVPKGDTLLKEGDRAILCTLIDEKAIDFELVEKVVDDDSPLVGVKLSEIGKMSQGLVVLIQRGESYIVPDGNVILEKGDHVLLNQAK